MKPIEITMNAFGTFAEECKISFEKLSKNSVFLIAGDTGAGKTTIFDAICFALYGTSSGEVRTADKDASCFRSHFVNDERITKVSFTFSCNNKIYRIERNPTYNYIITKKDGSTVSGKKTADADLFEKSPDGSEHLICGGFKKVNAEINKITGITSDQFRKIVMIAQGEFQKFLFASTPEKSAILQKLFDTEPYGLIKQKLSEKCAELNNKITIQRNNIIFEFKKVSPQNDFSKSEYLSIAESFEKNRYITREDIMIMIKMLEDSANAANYSLEESKTKRDEISARRDSLKAEIEKGKSHNQKIKKHSEKTSELLITKEKLNIALTEFQAAKKSAEKVPELEKQKSILLDRMDKYIELDKIKSEILELKKQLSSLESKSAYQKNQIENLKNKIQELENYFEKYTDPRIEYEKIDSRLKELKRSLEDLIEISKKLELYKKTLSDLKKCQKNYDLSYDFYFNKQKPFFDLTEKNFYAGYASILARTLHEKEPCPVCGSEIHPAPAAFNESTVTENQYQEAKKSCDYAYNKMKECQNILEKQKALAEERKIEADENISEKISELENQIRLLTAEKNKIQQKINDDDSKHIELKNIRQKLSESEQEYNSLNSKISDIQKVLSGKEQAAMIIKKDLSFNDIKTARKYLKEEISDKIDKYNSNLENAAQKLRLLELNTKSLEDFLKELESEINNIPEYNIQENEEIYKNMIDEEKNISEKISELRRHCKDCRLTIENVKKLSSTFFDENEKFRIYDELSEKISGSYSGAEKISFESFVQSYYLNQILENANIKLKSLSKGRYSLYRRESEKNHNLKSGLNIDVYDEYTNQKREIKTLSGGEVFLASLSLALGLSDTVQHRSGGIKLDAMFIDEGFGSLDSESLGSVIRILEQLSDNNRMIGIISHVSELSDRFNSKIMVSKSEHGSTAKVVLT